jgi:hypothetical protein
MTKDISEQVPEEDEGLDLSLAIPSEEKALVLMTRFSYTFMR